MSIRERVEEEFTRVLLAQSGYSVHFSWGDPVVVNDTTKEKLDIEDAKSIFWDCRELATTLYETMLKRVDWNRLSLEVWSALESFYPGEDFGHNNKHSGEALKDALETLDTFPIRGPKNAT